METVKQSVITGPNGELLFDIIEEVSDVVAGAQFMKDRNGFNPERTRRMNVSVPPRLYYYWANQLGEECWLDPSFLRSFIKEHPEYAACSGRI